MGKCMFLDVLHAQHTLSDQPLHRQGTQGSKAAADDPPAWGLFRHGQGAGYPDDHLANVLCSRQLAQRIGRLLNGEDDYWQWLYLACRSTAPEFRFSHQKRVDSAQKHQKICVKLHCGDFFNIFHVLLIRWCMMLKYRQLLSLTGSTPQ